MLSCWKVIPQLERIGLGQGAAKQFAGFDQAVFHIQEQDVERFIRLAGQ